MTPRQRPVVLCISGHDPSGGAGVQADIEAVCAQGCHPASVITALTDQDSRNAYAVTPTDSGLINHYIERVFEDLPVAAVKIGLLGSAATARCVAGLIKHQRVPIVLDPVIRATGGGELADRALVETMRDVLLPLATLVTPNISEMRRLAATQRPVDSCAAALEHLDANYILVTGGDESGKIVLNRLYTSGELIRCFEWPRLPYTYHGSGCTLSAASAGLLARGYEPVEAIEEAQRYTWHCLEHAHQPVPGHHFPSRLPGVRP